MVDRFSSQLDLVYGPDSHVNERYGAEPGRRLEPALLGPQGVAQLGEEGAKRLNGRLINACRKLYMLDMAGDRALAQEKEFISTQNREFPSLIWEDHIALLYDLEAMILFARSALDVSTRVFSALLLPGPNPPQIDSFNELSNRLSQDAALGELNRTLTDAASRPTSWFNALCSRSTRSLRDKIAHQTVLRLEYFEISPRSEKEYCHVIIGDEAVELELFVDEVSRGTIRAWLQFEAEAESRLTNG